MKYFVIFCFFLQFSCNSQSSETTHRKNIDLFIKDFFIKEVKAIDFNDLPGYINIDKDRLDKLDDKQKKVFYDYFLMLVNLEHEEIRKNNFSYSLYSEKDINSNLLKDYRLVNDNAYDAYYLVSNGKVVTHFLLDKDGKIVSFAPNVFTSQGGRIEPYMLNKLL